MDTLIEQVIQQMREDIVINGDVTAIEELLKTVPEEALRGYLPEES
jgi:hypothetical protein